MTRGTVVWVNLSDANPTELGKTRPGLVVSNSEQNQVLDTVVIIPLSSRPPDIWPLRVRLPSVSKMKVSFAVIPGIRQVSKGRLMEVIGRVPRDSMNEVEGALEAYLGE